MTSIPDPGFIAGHMKAFENDSVGAVAGKITEKQGRTFPGVREGRGESISGPGNWNIILPEMNTGMSIRLVGGNMSFRRKALRKPAASIGDTEELSFSRKPDAALAVRAKGYRIRYSPEAALTHLSAPGGGCRVPDYRREIYWYAHNFMLLFLKHFPRYTFPVWFSLRMAKLFRDAAGSLSFAPLVWGMRGFWDGYMQYRCKPGKP